MNKKLLLCLLCVVGVWGCSGPLTSNFLKYPTYVPGAPVASVEILTAEPAWPHIVLGEIIIEAMGEEGAMQGTIDKAKTIGAHAVRFTERRRGEMPGLRIWRSVAYRRVTQD